SLRYAGPGAPPHVVSTLSLHDALPICGNQVDLFKYKFILFRLIFIITIAGLSQSQSKQIMQFLWKLCQVYRNLFEFFLSGLNNSLGNFCEFCWLQFSDFA